MCIVSYRSCWCYLGISKFINLDYPFLSTSTPIELIWTQMIATLGQLFSSLIFSRLRNSITPERPFDGPGENGTEEWKVKVLVTQSCPTLCNPMDHSLPGSSVHGILQARILECVAIPFSTKGSSQPRDQTGVSCTAGRFFTVWATREEWKWHKIRGRDISWESLIVKYTNTSQILMCVKSRWSRVRVWES